MPARQKLSGEGGDLINMAFFKRKKKKEEEVPAGGWSASGGKSVKSTAVKPVETKQTPLESATSKKKSISNGARKEKEA